MAYNFLATFWQHSSKCFKNFLKISHICFSTNLVTFLHWICHLFLQLLTAFLVPVQPLYMLFLPFICPKLCVLVPVYLYFFIVLEVSAGMDLGPLPPISQFFQVNFQFFKDFSPIFLKACLKTVQKYQFWTWPTLTEVSFSNIFKLAPHTKNSWIHLFVSVPHLVFL